MMKKEATSFTHESLQDCQTIVGYLEALADGFAKGRLQLASNGREVVLDPQGLLKVGIKASRGQYRSKVVLRVSWRHDRPGYENTAESLQIGTPKVSD
jgi:amphi-Trp domain-containing protein